MSDLSGLPVPDLTTTMSTTASVPTDVNGYISLPITIDPSQLMADAFGFIQAQSSGWQPAEGHLETWLTEALAAMVATYGTVAAQMPVLAFEYLGGQLHNLPPETGAMATVPTTWTMADTQGYTVPTGTVVAFATSGNTTALFQTTAPFNVPPGTAATSAGAVTLTAVASGAAANGIVAGAMQMVSSLAFVASVVSTQPTSGGADPETTAQYLNRLSNLFKLLAPRPILASDFAALVASQAGVGRALGLDNFDPYNNALSALDASPTTSGGTWVAVTNCSLSYGANGVVITATTSGACSAKTGWYPVSAGQTYTGLATWKAATHAETTCQLSLIWGDINQSVLSTSAGTAVTDSTSASTASTVSATAPTGASYVRLLAGYTAAGSEAHDLSANAINLGTSVVWGAGGSQTGQERCVTVVPVDLNGNALTSAEMAVLASYLAAMREVNFLVFVVPPTYCAIAVVAPVIVNANADLDTVQAAVNAALTSYLSPAGWAGGSQTPPIWLNDPIVHYLSVTAQVNAVAGVHHCGALTLNGGTSDVTMPGYAPLPQPTVSVTVTSAPVGS